MSASHSAPNKILTYLLYIIIIAAVYEFLPFQNSPYVLLPNEISTERDISDSRYLKGYKVTKVTDGDTLSVEKDNKIEKVRLIGINTPETVDPRKTVECFGLEASNYMKDIALDKNVYLELDETQSKYDIYDRLLAYVYLEDGQMLNRKMLSGGYAYEYTYNTPYKYQKDFKDLQNFAKKEMRGLWSESTCAGQK